MRCARSGPQVPRSPFPASRRRCRPRIWPLWLALACGPSFEVLQEGDLRFAHCERLDLEREIVPSHRLHCWREWRRVYTYGQTKDRAEYAQRRIAELLSGDTSPAFLLPPAPLAGERAALHQAVTIAPASRGVGNSPRANCQASCSAALARCSEGCEVRATGCDPCRLEHSRCVKGCA